jgi:UDPglucose--hexose-1-phosphate uridylyltransferase
MVPEDRIRLERRLSRARLLSPLSGFAEVESSTEYRQDPLTSRVAIVGLNLAGKRGALYPETDEALLGRIAEETRPGCFFCPGKVGQATPRFPADLLGDEEGRLRLGGSTLFPNLFPLTDVHAVVALGGEHFLPLDRFSPELLAEGLGLAVDFVRRVTRREGAPRFFAICANYLQPGGASIVHPHLQAVGSSLPLTTQAIEIEAARRHHERHGTRFCDDLVACEEATGERFVARTRGPVAWLAAFAPRGNNEVQGHCEGASDVAALTDDHVAGLAEGLSAVLRVYAGLKLSTFNFCIYGAEVGMDRGSMGAYLSVVSRQSVVRNYRCDDYFLQKMLGTEILVDPPERIAELVRAELAPSARVSPTGAASPSRQGS